MMKLRVFLYVLCISSQILAMQPPEQPKIGSQKTAYDLVERNFAERLGECCCDHTQNPRCPNPCGCIGCACFASVCGMALQDACRHFLGHAQSNISALASAAGAIVGVTVGACLANNYALAKKRERWKQSHKHLDELQKAADTREAIQKLQDVYPLTVLYDDKKTN